MKYESRRPFERLPVLLGVEGPVLLHIVPHVPVQVVHVIPHAGDRFEGLRYAILLLAADTVCTFFFVL